MRPDIVALRLAGLVFIAIGIPLAVERVPPNHWYGFRTAKTFSNQTIRYAANRVAGIDLIIAGVVIALGVRRCHSARDGAADFDNREMGFWSGRWPLIGAALPVARKRCDHFTTLETPPRNVAATERTVSPATTRATARSRRPKEYGFVLHAGLISSFNLESEKSRFGNPSRFTQTSSRSICRAPLS